VQPFKVLLSIIYMAVTQSSYRDQIW